MSLTKRDGSPFWYARVQIAGRRYLLSTGTADKREAAAFERAERARLEREHEEGREAKRAPMTVALAVGRYWHETGQYQKGKDVLRHLDWLQARLGKNTQLRAITTREIAAVVAQRRADGVTNATVNRSVVEPLRRVLNRARDLWEEPVPRIHWRKLKLPEGAGRVREASASEEDRVIAAAREEYRPAIRFAILSGFRLGEVANLRWRDIDWTARTITVKGKGDKTATVPMIGDMEAVLRPLRGQHFEFVFTYVNRRKRRKGPAVGDRVPIPRFNLHHRFKEACAAAEVDGLRFHDLRHTAGSRITRAGGLRVAKELLRHADIKTTLRYSHVLDEDVRRAMEIAATGQTASKNGISEPAETVNPKQDNALSL
jgi:integrase